MYKPDSVRETSEGHMCLCEGAKKVLTLSQKNRRSSVIFEEPRVPTGVCRTDGRRKLKGCMNLVERSNLPERLGARPEIAEIILKRRRRHRYLCIDDPGKGSVSVGICPLEVDLQPVPVDLKEITPAEKRKRGRPRKNKI